MNEHDLVWHYCKVRPLHRPSTNWRTLMTYLLQIACGSIIGILLLYQTIEQLCGKINFSQSCFWLYLIMVLFTYRRFLIIAIELYQHYAPEHLRRKCICMPTCSEYAVICIKRYHFFKAIYKIYKRVTKECVGQIYHIDNP